MIVVNEESPRWLRELARYMTIKNLVFVYGNVNDLVSFPICPDSAEAVTPENVRWTESDLSGFFRRCLVNMKYEIVGHADAVEDLTFATPDMEALFNKVESGRDVSRSAKDKAAPSGSYDESAECAPTGVPTRKSNVVDWDRTISRIARVVQNTQVPCAFVINFASHFTSSPDRLSKDERTLFTKILKASLNTREVVREDGRWNNLLIFICEKLNDLPTFLYINNPRARSINLELPDREERSRFINRYYRHFYGVPSSTAEPPAAVAHDFVALTEGLTHYEMRSLVSLSIKEKIAICDSETGVSNVKRINEMYRYGVTTSEWDKIEAEKLANAEDFIRQRIKGQDVAVGRALDIIKRAKIGLAAGESSRSNRPRGVLFFAGPTGVGKTEMAKALTELLFGEEERLIRFDMSEYAEQQSDQRLLGAPPGYVGYEEGGQLTNAVKKNPFSILLFDEVEKAHGTIFDKFLQVLDDGRLTDSKGDTVYFSECIIIFTSNLGTVARSETSGAQMLVTPDMPYTQMKDFILESIRNHFNFTLGRPEILNRFGDNFVVFDFIKPPLDELIVDMLISKLVSASKHSKRITLSIEKAVRDHIVELARRNLQHGGRGIRNVVDAVLVNPLSRTLFDKNVQPHAQVRVTELVDKGEDAQVQFHLVVDVRQP